MSFRKPDLHEPRCVAQTARGERCRRVGVSYVGGAHVCQMHVRVGYINFFPPMEELDPMMELRRRAVLGLDDV